MGHQSRRSGDHQLHGSVLRGSLLCKPVSGKSVSGKSVWQRGLAILGWSLALTVGGWVGLGSRDMGRTQTATRQPLVLKADVQQFNSVTGVATLRGNVRLLYPSRQIEATAAQGQYFSRERRIVLSGNVYVQQVGNSIRAESVTYLIDEGRFVALPQTSQQVESIIQIQDRGTVPLAP